MANDTIQLRFDDSEVESGIKKLIAAFERLDNSVEGLQTQLNKGIKVNGFANINTQAAATSGAIDKVAGSLGNVDNAAKKGSSSVGDFFKGGLALQAFNSFTGAAAAFGGEILRATSAFQKFDIQLSKQFGSKEAGSEAFAELRKFAAETPFQLEEVVGAFIKLKQRGLEPTKAELTQLGDLALSQGKSLDQLTEAILDAQTGEFERLKEFGVVVRKQGEDFKVQFGTLEPVILKSATAVEKYVVSLGLLPSVQGTAKEVSQTLGGALSNLEDSYTNLAATIGDFANDDLVAVIGFFKGVLDGATELVKVFDEGGIEDGLNGITGAAKPIADALSRFLDVLTEAKDGVANFGESIFANGDAREFLQASIDQSVKVFETLIDVVSFAVEAVNDFATPIREGLVPILRILFDLFADVVSLITGSIPTVGGAGEIFKTLGSIIKNFVLVPLEFLTAVASAAIKGVLGISDEIEKGGPVFKLFGEAIEFVTKPIRFLVGLLVKGGTAAAEFFGIIQTESERVNSEAEKEYEKRAKRNEQQRGDTVKAAAFLDGIAKKSEEERKKAAEKQAEITAKQIEKLKELAAEYEKLADNVRKQAQDANLDNLSERDRIFAEREIATRQLNLLKEEAAALAKKTGKNIDLSEEFAILQFNIDYAARIKALTLAEKERLDQAKAAAADLQQIQDELGTSDAPFKPNLGQVESKPEEQALPPLPTITDAELAKLRARQEELANRAKDALSKIKFKIGDLIGFETDGQTEFFFDNLSEAYGQFFDAATEIYDAQIQQNDNLIAGIDARIAKEEELLSEKESALEKELEFQKQGLANNVTAAQLEVQTEKARLDALQKEREAAVKKGQELQKKAARLQAAQDIAQQVSSTAVSVANIFKGATQLGPILGPIVAGVQIAAMFASIAASIKKAKAIANQPAFYKGGQLPFGKTDKHGGEGYSIMDGQRKIARIGGGEFVVNEATTAEHLPFLKKLNEGRFDGSDLERSLEGSLQFDRRAVKRIDTREAQIEVAKIAFQRSAIEGAIEKQTEQLMKGGFNKLIARPQYVSTPNGYNVFQEDEFGNKKTQRFTVKKKE